MYLTIYHESGKEVAQLRYNGRRISVSSDNEKIIGNLERYVEEGFDRFVGKHGRKQRIIVEPSYSIGLIQALAYFYATQFGFVSVLTDKKPKKNMVLGRNGKYNAGHK